VSERPPGDLVDDAVGRLGIACERMECDPDFADTAAFCARYAIAPEDCANAILVSSKKEPRRHAVCVVLATTRLDVNHRVRELLAEKRLSFASPEETVRVTGMLVGGVTPFGLPEGVPVYIDAAVLGRSSVIVGGGGRSSKLRLDPRELLKAPGAVVIEGLARPREDPSRVGG
jgi:prolyl-tRNA editing enzyme YbaK/EbsC (Cys-tRNA(Pro) deacylase)